MKRQLYAVLATVAALAAAFAVLLALSPDDRPKTADWSGSSAAAAVVREDSHRLSDPANSELTLVEFLDFECEACGAYYPVVKRLREEYGDRVTFVARYFPMPGHHNGETAALAAEAAARQGRFEDMYNRLFSTQAAWGESRDSHAATFRGFAEDLGLDMAAYDAAVADPATAERIQADIRDGLALGVQGTPTFFFDDRPLSPPASYEQFVALIEDELS
ncbi:thioredoxin domain-containing protein [Streptomyces xiamenensis]|uniref:DsbA family protein n=1 Tax=Streptomyces xiamenensis TaxID=408015 RepID=UPI003437C34D